MAYDLDWDVSNDTPIDEDAANSVMNAGETPMPHRRISPTACTNGFRFHCVSVPVARSNQKREASVSLFLLINRIPFYLEQMHKSDRVN